MSSAPIDAPRSGRTAARSGTERTRIRGTLADAGFVAPALEADALLEAAAEGAGTIEELLERRILGEPLAWIVGSIRFCGIRIRVDPGVFVPRPQTEALARRAIELLPADGVAVDLCTGSGAVGGAGAAPPPRPPRAPPPPAPPAGGGGGGPAVGGPPPLLGDLDRPIPRSLRGRVDVLTAVVPYVPTDELRLLPRDVVAYEPRRALDGGPAGTTELARVAASAPRWLRPGGTVLLELGGDQAGEVTAMLIAAGLTRIAVHRDGDGRDRAIEARTAANPAGGGSASAARRGGSRSRRVPGPPAPGGAGSRSTS